MKSILALDISKNGCGWAAGLPGDVPTSGVEPLGKEWDTDDKVFRNMALSARDAALLASPILIPGVKYEKTQTLTINLDPKAVLR